MGIYRKKGFIKGEALRLLRTNSVRENFEQSKRDLERGYPLTLVQKILTEVKFTDRNEVFRNITKRTNTWTKEILPFVTTHNTYNPATSNLKKKQLEKKLSCWQLTVTSALVTLRSSLGTFVGNKAHRLCPDTRLFHALVPRGSMWIPVPERAGPITNHLKKYRSDKIKTLLVSKCVLMNKPKRKMTDFHLKFSLIPLTIHYCAILTRFQCVGKLLYGKTKGIRSSKSRVSVIWSFYTVFFTCMGAFSSLQQI